MSDGTITLRMKARKLENVDVSFVSLVERGANRIPFRIIKSKKGQEDGMIDLKTLFRARKSEESTAPETTAASELAAVVVDKGVVTDSLIQKMEEKSFVMQESKEDDKAVVFKSEDYDEDAAVVAMDENVAVVLSKVKKAFYDYPDTTDFDKNLAKSSFFPSFEMAEDALDSTIENILYGDSIAPADKAAAIGAAIDSFKAYVMALVNGLPDAAFEMAKYVLVSSDAGEVLNAEKSEKAEKAEVGEEADTEVSAGAESTETVVQKEEIVSEEEKAEETEAVQKSEGDEVVDDKAEASAEGESVQKRDHDAKLDALIETVAKMSTSVSDLSSQLAEVVMSTQALGERVEKAEATAESAIEAVESTVLSGSVEEGDPAKVKKSEPTEVFAGTALDKLGL